MANSKYGSETYKIGLEHLVVSDNKLSYQITNLLVRLCQKDSEANLNSLPLAQEYNLSINKDNNQNRFEHIKCV